MSHTLFIYILSASLILKMKLSQSLEYLEYFTLNNLTENIEILPGKYVKKIWIKNWFSVKLFTVSGFWYLAARLYTMVDFARNHQEIKKT